ncbi:MAG: hypothetical protein GF421_05270 [Candidatus Aminicenantes bacterium]|nr:hypothetical protein [Candidatus Aminicenantes bacterium]
MLKLCWKDFYVTRWFWIPAPFFFVLLLSTFIFSKLSYLIAGVILTFAMMVSIPLLEDHYRTEGIISSLPIKIQSIVLSRYISSLFIILIGLFFWMASSFFYGFLFPESLTDLKSLQSFEGGAVFLSLSLLLVVLFFPLSFRYGAGKALFVFPAVIISFSAIIWGALQLFSKGISHSVQQIPVVLIILILLTLFSGIMSFSVFLSNKFYKSKEK